MGSDKQKAYVSYARKGSRDFVAQLVNGAVDEFGLASCRYKDNQVSIGSLNDDAIEDPRVADWEITFDEAALQAGDSIRAYMDQLIEGEQIIIVLSNAYFKSIFCMHELIGIYLKRAGKLLPVVVADKDFELTDTFEQDLLVFWRKKATDALEKGEKEKAQNCHEISEYLPLVIGWLLGPYDRKLAYFEDFLLRDNDERTVLNDIWLLLKNPRVIRYRVFSNERRELDLKERIERFVQDRDLETEVKLFDSLLNEANEYRGVERFLIESKGPEGVGLVLRKIGRWLDKLKADSSQQRADFRYLTLKVRELIGWILMRTVNEKELQRFTHFLNHQQEDAQVPMPEENRDLLPIVVAALCDDAAWFNLAEGLSLKGERELCFIERGILANNFENYWQDERAWSRAIWGLFCQISVVVMGEKPDEKAIPDDDRVVDKRFNALRKIALEERKTGLYLPFEEGCLKVVNNISTFLSQLGKEAPEITQVKLAKEKVNTAETVIDQEIRDELPVYIVNIYSKLRELTNEQGNIN